MSRIVNIVGARPQFIKCACVSREIRKHSDLEEIIIHTGQHYDSNMSEIFFRELDIPEPDVNLGIGSASHAVQTAGMLTAIGKALLEVSPDRVVVYGDTNSTLAGAIAASKLNMPIAHVEAGLRSFNREMPEEINRIVTDHVADLLLAPTRTAMDLLAGEGLAGKSVLTGDVMYDSVLYSRGLAEKKFSGNAGWNKRIKELAPDGEFYLSTVHRAENTDHPDRLAGIFKAFSKMDLPVVLPLHPRTKNTIGSASLSENIKLIEPMGYLEMLMMLSRCEKVLTDSGGLQKEAYFLDKQCITLREETEWTETLKDGWNTIAGTDPDRILEAVSTAPSIPRGNYFGDGDAAAKIVAAL